MRQPVVSELALSVGALLRHVTYDQRLITGRPRLALRLLCSDEEEVSLLGKKLFFSLHYFSEINENKNCWFEELFTVILPSVRFFPESLFTVKLP